jgi:hypothetical protein
MPNLKPTHRDLTDEEEAAVLEQIEADRKELGIDAGDFSEPKPARDVHPEAVKHWERAREKGTPSEAADEANN